MGFNIDKKKAKIMANIATLKKLLEKNNYVLSRKQLSEPNFSGQQKKIS